MKNLLVVIVSLLMIGIIGIANAATLSPPIGLTGDKTINPGGSGDDNYTSFTLAINALNTSGVGAGGVIFTVTDGTT